jgi:hypothetical protein
MTMRQYGDFQTPPGLVAAVLDSPDLRGGAWTRLLEPTCGRGHFMAGAIARLPGLAELVGIELQPQHHQAALEALAGRPGPDVRVRLGSVFDVNLGTELGWRGTGPLLVLGNPPWVTSAELGALGSANVPAKRNFKALRGLAAVTGSANFDLAETILLKVVAELAHDRPTVAMLCKTAVAREVIRHAHAAGLPIAGASVRRIDAKAWFKAGVDACLFVLHVDPDAPPWDFQVPVYPALDAPEPASVFGVVDGQFVADVPRYHAAAFADGESPLVWRQGLKHDAVAVMELRRGADGALRNKLGEVVDVEPDFVFPLLKSSMLFGEHPGPRAVLVTQRALREDTRRLAKVAPRLWAYLERHEAIFAARKSTIYRNQPPFAMFGIGDYAFAPYKVAVSGLYKAPRFRVLGPVDGRPVMVDDTCYFVPCASAAQAALVGALLNHPTCTDLIGALAFWDAMRPITKKLLQRLDLAALAARLDPADLLAPVNAALVALGAAPFARAPGDWAALLAPSDAHGRLAIHADIMGGD